MNKKHLEYILEKLKDHFKLFTLVPLSLEEKKEQIESNHFKFWISIDSLTERCRLLNSVDLCAAEYKDVQKIFLAGLKNVSECLDPFMEEFENEMNK